MLNKEQKTMLTALFAETWKDEKMIKYEVGKTLSAFDLRGKTIVIEKKSIKTNFCFGYSLSRYDSEDFDRANDMAEYAQSNELYFIRENHANSNYGQIINLLNDPRYKFYARQKYYTGKNLYDIDFCRVWEAIPKDAFELNDAEKQLYKTELVKAIKEHHKKIVAYLKRYGMKKVNTWSYWQDA